MIAAVRFADPRGSQLSLALLLAIMMLLPWTAFFGANCGGVQLAATQTDCPLIGQGIDPYTAGIVTEKPKVFLSVQLKKLISVDAVTYSYKAYFQVVATWRDPRVNNTLAINNAVSAFGPAITGLATAKCKPNVTFSGFNISQKDECLKTPKQNNLPQMDGCSKPCTPSGTTCCDALWIPSLTIDNVLFYPQDRFQTESIYFFGQYSNEASSIDREVVVGGAPPLLSPPSSPSTPLLSPSRPPLPSSHPLPPLPSFPSATLLSLHSPSVLPPPLFPSSVRLPSPVLLSRLSTRMPCLARPLLPQHHHTASTSTAACSREFSSPLSFKKFPLDTQTLRLSIQVESGEFYLVGSNSGRQSEQGGGQLGGGGGTYVNDEVTGWKINDVALNCTPSATTVSTSATYHPGNHLRHLPYCVYLCFSVFFARPDDLETRSATFVTLFLALSAVQFVIDSQLPRSSVMTQFGNLVIISYVFISLTALETLIVYLIAERLEKDVVEAMGDMAAAATRTSWSSRAEPEAESPDKVESTCASVPGKADGAGEEGQELCPVATDGDDEEVGDTKSAAGSGGGEKLPVACLNPGKPPLQRAEGPTWKFSLFGYHLKPIDEEREREGNYTLAARIDFVCCVLFFFGYTLTVILLYTL
ncbi:unnamed protein product [Closterium sp. Naga37s-1]|nr:unnamed protein product [Closterium sp. Naga37s-1]